MKLSASRPARITFHRARREKRKNVNDDEYCRKAYIEFINKLMHRMRMDGISRMLDTDLEEIDQ